MTALRDSIDTLLGQYSIFADGNLQRNQTVADPPQLVIFGTGEKGADNQPLAFTADTIDQVLRVFGARGTLAKEVQEAQSKGVNSALLKRIGAQRIFLQHIGASGSASIPAFADPLNGYWIELNVGGTEYGTRFGMAFEKASGRLILQDLAATRVIFDNDPSYPVDLGLVYLRGQVFTSVADEGSDIGTISPLVTVALNAASALGDTRIHYYGGHAGTTISRMKTFEGFFQGLFELENYRYRYIAAPNRGTLDCPWTTSMSVGTGANALGTSYPLPFQTSSTSPDMLGAVWMEEVDGRVEFYWDVNNDGLAEYWSVNDTGQYYQTSKGGELFTSTHFQVPNFAYVLGYHCYRTTLESHLTEGVFGVEPPPIGKPLSEWLGTKPILATDAQGTVTVVGNGTKLLGHKYMAGNTTYRAGKAYGGMVLTNTPWFDGGSEILDPNDQPVDLGKHLVAWITPELFDPQAGVNNNQGYYAISPAAYAGFLSILDARESPSNLTYPAASIFTAQINRRQKDELREMRYTYAHQDGNSGIKILEAPTAAHPSSDFSTQLSMRLLLIVDLVYRNALAPYLGRPIDPQEEVSMQNDLTEARNAMIKARVLKQGSQVTLVLTAQDRSVGQAAVKSDNWFPFELRKITHTHSMRQTG